MIPYSLHVALLLAVFLLFYKVFLRKVTYYGLNRWVLLVCAGLALALPLLSVPAHLSLRKAGPVQVELPEYTPPAGNVVLSKDAAPVSHVSPQPLFNTANIIKWTMWLYWSGVIIFGANFLLQVITLLYQAWRRPVIRDGIYRIVEMEGDKAPCSFGNIIYINPALYDWETYSQILLHEKVHVRKVHTLDLVITELVLVLQWFNPFAWLYRKTVDANLEFLTDDTLLRAKGVERESYQLNLLKVAVPNYAMHITTNYNQSLLKKRILMMNAKQSNIHSSWKYLMLMPLVAVLVGSLNQPSAAGSALKVTKAKPQPLVKPAVNALKKPEPVAPEKVTISPSPKKDTTSLSANALKELAEMGITPDYIQAFKAMGYPNLNFETLKMLSAWDITPSYVKALLDIKYDVSMSTLQQLIKWDITPNYIKALQEIKYDVSLPALQSLVGWDITPDYIKALKEIKYDVSLPTLQALVNWDVTPDYIRGLQQIGYKDISLDALKAFTSWDITPSYIKGFMDIGYKDVSVATLVKFIGADVTPSFVKDLKNYKGLSADKIIAAANNE